MVRNPKQNSPLRAPKNGEKKKKQVSFGGRESFALGITPIHSNNHLIKKPASNVLLKKPSLFRGNSYVSIYVLTICTSVNGL